MRVLLLPAFLVLTVPVFANADDACLKSKSASACVDCAEEMSLKNMSKITKEGKKERQEAEAKGAPESEIDAIFDKVQSGRQDEMKALAEKVKECEKIVPAKKKAKT